MRLAQPLKQVDVYTNTKDGEIKGKVDVPEGMWLVNLDGEVPKAKK